MRLNINSTLLSWVIRLLSIGVQFLAVRLITEIQGPTGFGLYSFLGALIGIGAQFDLGLGIFLQNRLTATVARGRPTNHLSEGMLHSAALLGGIWACAGALVIIGIHFTIPNSNTSTYAALFPLAVAFGISNIYARTAYASGNGKWIYIYQLAYQATFLIFLIVQSALEFKVSVPITIGIYYALYTLCNFAVGISKGAGPRSMRWRPSLQRFRTWINQARGFAFFGLIGLIITQLDIIIIGSFGEFHGLAYYTFITKVFFAGCYTFISISYSLEHPKIASCWAAGDAANLRHRIRRMLATSAMLSLAFFLCFYIGERPIANLIIPGVLGMKDSTSWTGYFMIFFFIRVISDGLLTILLALSRSRLINSVMCIQAPICAFGQIAIFPHMGISGILIIQTISYTLAAAIYYKTIHRALTNDLKRK